MSARTQVAAYRDAMALAGAKEIRLALATPAAVAVARELAPADARHPEQLAAALQAWDEYAALPVPGPDEFDATLAHAKAGGVAADVFWEAFEGQPVDGVEIIRRRA
jgi:hypothetical protein